MTTRIGFLRAVNVGKRTVRMAQLAEVCTGLGYTNVWTHINSGNVVFDAPGSRESIERAIGAALEHVVGFEVTTFVRTVAEVSAALQVRPFPVEDGDTYFITFLLAPPPAEVTAALEAASNDFDTLVVVGRDVHWRMRGSSMETTVKASTWNRIGKLGTTSRNVNMLTKLVAKIDR